MSTYYCSRAHYANQDVQTEDSFFPPLNGSDYDMLDDAERWFSPQNSSASFNRPDSDLILDESAELRQVIKLLFQFSKKDYHLYQIMINK